MKFYVASIMQLTTRLRQKKKAKVLAVRRGSRKVDVTSRAELSTALTHLSQFDGEIGILYVKLDWQVRKSIGSCPQKDEAHADPIDAAEASEFTAPGEIDADGVEEEQQHVGADEVHSDTATLMVAAPKASATLMMATAKAAPTPRKVAMPKAARQPTSKKTKSREQARTIKAKALSAHDKRKKTTALKMKLCAKKKLATKKATPTSKKKAAPKGPAQTSVSAEASTTSSSTSFQLGERVQIFYEGWKDGIVTSIDPLLVRYELLPDEEGLAYDLVRKHPSLLSAKSSDDATDTTESCPESRDSAETMDVPDSNV
jgi:hypothetical protein